MATDRRSARRLGVALLAAALATTSAPAQASHCSELRFQHSRVQEGLAALERDFPGARSWTTGSTKAASPAPSARPRIGPNDEADDAFAAGSACDPEIDRFTCDHVSESVTALLRDLARICAADRANECDICR